MPFTPDPISGSRLVHQGSRGPRAVGPQIKDAGVELPGPDYLDALGRFLAIGGLGQLNLDA